MQHPQKRGMEWVGAEQTAVCFRTALSLSFHIDALCIHLSIDPAPSSVARNPGLLLLRGSQRIAYDLLSLAHNDIQMRLVPEAFRIELVDVLRA